ncbi:hypothetical protein MAUB1S_11868 [Mycolicibacterium aubagnense]
MSMDRTQRVDVELIASLLGVDIADARDLLHGLVYPSVHDPEELVPATTALSGNVRTKLTAALAAAGTDPAYNGYVRALQAAMPPQRQAETSASGPERHGYRRRWWPRSRRKPSASPTSRPSTSGGRWVVEVPSHKRHGRLMCDELAWTKKDSTRSASWRRRAAPSRSSSPMTMVSWCPRRRSPPRPR